MTSLIDKIEQLIKREKTTPERKRKKEETTKSSNEILSELFSAFNADPPQIDESVVKKSKKSKKKHKKEKKKRSRSSSSSSDSDDSEYGHTHKRKKRKKSKSKKRKHDRSLSLSPAPLPPIKPDPDLVKKEPKKEKTIDIRVKEEKIKEEPNNVPKKRVSIKYEEPSTPFRDPIDAASIPMPDSPSKEHLDSSDLRLKLECKKSEAEGDNDKSKGKIQIKNLKFSAVFEETVKKAEEEAKQKAKMVEEGEYTDSSSSSEKQQKSNSMFPKSSDPSGILKRQADDETRMLDEVVSRKSKYESSHKSSKRDRKRRSTSRSRRSRSSSRRRHPRSSSKPHHRRSRSRHRSVSRSRHRSGSRSRRRSGSRSRLHRSRISPIRHRPRRSPTGVRLADHEKKRLLEVARRNAINMLKNGAVPAGAAALPPHTRNQVMAAIQSGGKSVDELTDFCKHLSKKEALGELSSVSSHDEGSENEDTLAFHHPFLVKEKAPIVMNIRGGVPLPVKSSLLPIANKDELSQQFPVSSGTQHRQKAIEWTPVSPKKDHMEVAKLNSKPAASSSTKAIAIGPKTPDKTECPVPLALPAPAPAPAAADPPPYMKAFTTGAHLTTLPDPSLPAPGPQAYPPGVKPPATIDLAQIVSQKIAMIRKEQEHTEIPTRALGFGWSRDKNAGLFTGSTGANILTPRELAAGTQAWAKKDQLVRAAPVHGGMGMALLQKMGWTPGQGLGKEGTGTLQPLMLEVKLDTKGLQAREEIQNKGKGARGNIRQIRRPGGPAPLVAGGKHPVSLLGEYCSKQKVGPPEYTLCFECGPDHKKNFLFKVKVAGVEYQPAVASINKKQAKADAANLALQKLGIITT